MNTTTTDAKELPPMMDSPNTRRARSSSTVSTVSSTSGKPKGQKSQRKSSSLPAETVEYLKAWMMSPEHVAHPYPTEQEKSQIMADTGIELKQLTNWFVNNRKRFWKPRVEARLQQQAHAQVAAVAVAASMSHVVSPHVERPTFGITQQQNGATTPYLTLDMTQPQQQMQTPSFESGPNIIPSDAFTKFVSVANAVSDSSTSGSSEENESGSCTSSSAAEDLDNEVTDEVDEATGIVTRTESVDVHILRPISGGTPTIEDVTILSNVPQSRIIRSYRNCMMAYTFPKVMTEDRKKIQSRRDGEIVRIKKHFLRNFLSDAPPVAPVPTVPAAPATPPQKRKRSDSITAAELTVLRPKFARKNAPATWRDSCSDATHYRCSSLPSMEEAASLFGYSQ